ncbi:MAG: hypothetical protein JWQ15_2176, partial [Marmoricola sp.]|nr:hypothetical protein [Marmoricola sp.]
MQRIQLYAAGVVVALVPAVVGLAGNASFSQSVPLRSPDRSSNVDARPTKAATPSAKPTGDANDDRGRGHGGHGGDDRASDKPTHVPTHDAGDDKGGRNGGHGADDGSTHDAGDDKGGRNGGHGADDGAGHDVGDDHGG